MKLNKEFVKEIFYPRTCPVCGKVLGEQFKNDDPPLICGGCSQKLDFITGPRCMRCSRSVNDGEEFCSECKSRKNYFDSGIALMRHDESARKILYDLKYSDMKDNANLAGRLMAERYGKLIEFWDADAFIPVPLHKKRMRRRGYNQAELIARKTAEFMEKQGRRAPRVDTSYLFRIKQTDPLKGQDIHERARTMNKAMQVDSEREIYRKVILVDDIFTTGATVNECAKEMRMTGTSVVYFLSVSIGDDQM